MREEKNYHVITEGNVPVKAWVNGVNFEDKAKQQLINIANLPIIHKWVAAMPDVHLGIGATIGSVIPTLGAVIPAAVGVDIGCGMMAARTNMTAKDLPTNLKGVREEIEKAVPHGMTPRGRGRDKGSWYEAPDVNVQRWNNKLKSGFDQICEKHPRFKNTKHIHQLGTLGGGNHFIEVCLDTEDNVWLMLHSGSRGVGNRIGTSFIEMAKKDMQQYHINMPDKNLSYFPEGTERFDDYVLAVSWAQEYARINREIMMENVIKAVKKATGFKKLKADLEAVNCHHNYISKEYHYGKDVYVTRKGAVRAGEGEMGIIPGSMGAKSYIVRGKGNPVSFNTCSHGAGRVMSRTAAKNKYTSKDQKLATEGVECRKDKDVVDEIPMAYKDIDKVMDAQKDLVDIVHTLKQVVCVKG